MAFQQTVLYMEIKKKKKTPHILFIAQNLKMFHNEDPLQAKQIDSS